MEIIKPAFQQSTTFQSTTNQYLKMKLIASLIISTILAVPLKFRPSSGIEIDADINIITNVDLTSDIEAANTDNTKDDEVTGLFEDLSDELDEETIAMIDQMSADDWDEFFTTMIQEFEQLSGVNLQNIDDMSDEEFQTLLNSISE